MDVVVKVTPDFASALASTANPSTADFYQTLRLYGAKLSPPTGTIGETAQYFLITSVASERVNDLVESLRQQRGVEAAYVKPSDELP